MENLVVKMTQGYLLSKQIKELIMIMQVLQVRQYMVDMGIYYLLP